MGSRSIPASFGVRSPLRRLQGAQAATTLSQAVGPPRERGIDMQIFSPRAVGMGHHIGDEATSQAWTRICNDLIHRVVGLFATT